MIATSDLHTLRMLSQHLQDVPGALVSDEQRDALDRALTFLGDLRKESKRETATLAAVDDLIKMTDEAVEATDNEAIGDRVVAVGIGLLGMIANVATNAAAIADRMAVIAEAHKPQLIVERAPTEDEEWARADVVVDPRGIIRKNKHGHIGDAFEDFPWSIVGDGRSVRVYFAKGDKP